MQIENKLIQSCANQNRVAQKELYLLLLPYLRAVANRYLKDTSYSKDVLQESFVKLFNSIKNYDPNKAPLKNWAARIVINTSINYNDRVAQGNTEELVIEIHETPTTEPADFSDSELMNLLKQMPSGYFEVFNLSVIDGYSHKEISLVVGITEALSRKKLSRAKSWMQNAYAKSCLNQQK